MEAIEELKKGIIVYINKAIKDANADITYSALIKSSNDDGYNILMNNVEYQNIPTIGGTCVSNEVVRVLIPQGNYNNMVILKGGDSNGTIGGTDNYNDLKNKPKINEILLTDNKTFNDLGILPLESSEIDSLFEV